MSLEQFCTNDFSCAFCGKVVKRQNVEKWEIEAYLDWLANGDERKHIWLHESCNKKLFRIGMSVHCVVKE